MPMAESALFSPAQLRGLTLDNRIVVAPMCQYSATDGTMSDWHMMHLGSLSNSGAGLLILEATGVEPEGRISPACPGLYSDANEQALTRVVSACKQFGKAKIGIQLGHAGRKGSTKRPWDMNGHNDRLVDGAWQTKAPSARPFAPGWIEPVAMTEKMIDDLLEKFVAATQRADRAGVDLIEIHGAHGYLLNQFLSPLSNKREDRWGGSLENRMRLPLEVFKAMRAVWPDEKPLGIRISAVEWVEGGLTIEESVELSRRLKDLGCDFMDVSTGGNDPSQKIVLGPGYQVPFAERIKREVGIPVMAVGLITEPEQAEEIIADGKADFVALARAFLDDPHWGWHAAYRLGAIPNCPPQYLRATLKTWPPAQRYAAPA
jgi:2,4-dienoyl-CoA reductase-like NADH-dependent reductase (Old Yellow Enzyme family)